MKKKELLKLSKKIKRLVQIHGQVKLEMYHYLRGGKTGGPYGTRHLRKNGNCMMRYYDYETGFKGRGRMSSCFMDDYSVYTNGEGDEIIKRSLIETLRAMETHDYRCYQVKFIYAGGRKISV